jgi:murein hydrolase activator
LQRLLQHVGRSQGLRLISSRCGPIRSGSVGSLAAVLLLVPGLGSAADKPTPDEARQKLEMHRSQLDATKERAKFLQGDLAELKLEREKMNAKLLETAAAIQNGEGRLTGIEGRLSDMERQETALRVDLSKNSDRIAKLMAALQRMGRNPPPVLFTQRSDALQMVRSAMLLASAFPELRKDALALAGKLNALIAVTTEIRTERDSLKTETARLADARTRLSGLIETKKQTLVERTGELAQVRAAAAEISKNVSDLNDLIVKLDAAVTTKTGLGAYDAEARLRAAEPVKPGVPFSPAIENAIASAPDVASKPTIPGSALTVPGATDKPREVASLVVPPPAKPLAPKPSVVELAPASMSLGGPNPGRMKPSMAFGDARARLPSPAQGRRVLAFGDKTQFGGQSKGIVIETRSNGQITSPCDGWIVYAGEFRSYGQLLIINAGGGYHVLLAGLSQIDVQPGQFVLAAEPVGTMSGTSTQAKAPSNSPVLYVEFRKDGRPIDPDPWWVDGHQKVQG